MRQTFSAPRGAQSKLLRIAWFLSSILVLFALENIWIDPLLRAKFHRIPSLVPEPLSGLWFLALMLVVIFSIFLIIVQIFVARDREISQLKKWSTGCFSLCALLLCVLWFVATVNGSTPGSLLTWHRHAGHKVTLKWNASKSVVEGYNIYRALSPTGPFAKINKELVRGLSFVDEDVRERTKYYYVARAVDAGGLESVNSNVALADVP